MLRLGAMNFLRNFFTPLRPHPPRSPTRGGCVLRQCSAAPGVAEEYTWPPSKQMVTTWLTVTQTSRLTSPSQERPPVFARIRDQRGVLLAPARSRGITQPPGLPSPGISGSPHTANMWEDILLRRCTNLTSRIATTRVKKAFKGSSRFDKHSILW